MIRPGEHDPLDVFGTDQPGCYSPSDLVPGLPAPLVCTRAAGHTERQHAASGTTASGTIVIAVWTDGSAPQIIDEAGARQLAFVGGTGLSVHTDAECSSFPLDARRLVAEGQLTAVGLLRHGTGRGRASVSMVVTLADGTQVFAQTTWALLRSAYAALAASPIAAEEVDEP